MKTKLINVFGIAMAILLLHNTDYAYAQAPGLWGMTSEGGVDEVGTIFKMNPDGTNLAVNYSFTVVNAGARPYINAQLLQLPSGKLYGVTSDGGNNSVGVLFEYDPSTGVYTKKRDFSNAIGRAPMGSLALASNGKLYGISTAGGANNLGTIYEYDPATNVLTKKIDLSQANGHSPYGNSLYFHTNGKFYGMTVYGGSNNLGVLFEYDPATNAYSKKIDFVGSINGSYPYGSLMVTSAGKVFGMTSQGGANNFGTLFEYAPSTNTLTKRFDFTAASGSQPYSALVEGNNNRLYGVTPSGGGLFEFNPATNTFTKKLDFNTNANGTFPYGTPTKGANGKLYGMTAGGGSTSNGVIYEYDIATNTISKKFDFAIETGTGTFGALTLANNGNLYGMTYQGGSTGSQGVIFEYNPTTETHTKKIDFELTPNGSYPFGGLTQAANKKLYGMTIQGGSTNKGVLFELDPATNVFTKMHDFATETGEYPQGSLSPAPNGKLYGMTSGGGSVNNDGVLFEFDPTTGTYTVKVEFDYDNGSEPFGNLTLASNNKFYGTTSQGGTSGYGVIFEFDPATSVYTKKTEFDFATIGFNPYDALVEVSSGKFYGTCRDGGLNGNGYGTLFEYDLNTNTITKKLNFTGPNGESPEGSLVKAPNGKLYGVTRRGGTNSLGVLFEYDINTDTYTKKIDFGATSLAPAEPAATLTLSTNGKLYGSTLFGGANNRGVIFEFDPVTTTFVKKHDFIGTNGAGLFFGKLLFVKGEQSITFNALNDKLVDDAAFTLSATSSASLPITYTSSNTAVATVSGATLTIVGAGTTTITASQTGDANYNAATSVTRTLTVNKLNQTITFNALSTTSFGDPNFSLGATTTSGLSITYTSSNTAVATVSGNTVTIVSAGVTTITASQPGDASYNAATSVSQTLTVNKINQTITFAAITDKTVGDPAFALTASTTSSLPVSFNTVSNKITINGAQVNIVSAGRVTITATQTGNNNYNAATPVERSFCIKPAQPTITLSNLNSEAPILTSSASTGNQWYRNDVVITGATNTVLTATEEGTYKVRSVVDDCVSDFSDEVILVVTSLEESGNQISLFPNPTADWLTVSLNELNGNKQVSIVNAQGSVKESKEVEGSEATFNVAGYARGVYFVKVKMKNSVRILRFVKQ